MCCDTQKKCLLSMQTAKAQTRDHPAHSHNVGTLMDILAQNKVSSETAQINRLG